MNDENKKLDVDSIVGFENEPFQVSYNTRDVIIYSLGIGSSDLRYCYENHQDFQVFPTFILTLPFKGTSTDIVPFPSPNLVSFPSSIPIDNPANLLHGEQYLRIFKPLDPEGGVLTVKSKILGIHDKQKGALLRAQDTFYDQNGEKVAISIRGAFFIGLTGFQSKSLESTPAKFVLPSRLPDAIFFQTTEGFQAMLYRLSGDYNPLHIDPDSANSVGFQKPIMHGLCTLGFALRGILQECFCDGRNVQSIEVRFSRPTLPGDRLKTKMWFENSKKIIFETVIEERNVVVLSGGVVELFEPISLTQSKL